MGTYFSLDWFVSSNQKKSTNHTIMIQPVRTKPYDIFERPFESLDVVYENETNQETNQDNPKLESVKNETHTVIYYHSDLKQIKDISNTTFYHPKKKKTSPIMINMKR